MTIYNLGSQQSSWECRIQSAGNSINKAVICFSIAVFPMCITVSKTYWAIICWMDEWMNECMVILKFWEKILTMTIF